MFFIIAPRFFLLVINQWPPRQQMSAVDLSPDEISALAMGPFWMGGLSGGL